jgi:hypothetical protein
MKTHLRQAHSLLYIPKVEGVHFRSIFIQAWFPHVKGSMGTSWRVDFSKPRHPIFQQPIFDESIAAHNAEYYTRLQQFFTLGTIPVAKRRNPLKELTLEPNNSDSDLDRDAIHVPIDPLLEAKLIGTQRKDDVDAFVQKA